MWQILSRWIAYIALNDLAFLHVVVMQLSFIIIKHSFFIFIMQDNFINKDLFIFLIFHFFFADANNFIIFWYLQSFKHAT